MCGCMSASSGGRDGAGRFIERLTAQANGRATLSTLTEEAGTVAPELQSRSIPCNSRGMRWIKDAGQIGVCVRMRCACERALRLENRRPRKGIVGSNPTLSATDDRTPRKGRLCFRACQREVTH